MVESATKNPPVGATGGHCGGVPAVVELGGFFATQPGIIMALPYGSPRRTGTGCRCGGGAPAEARRRYPLHSQVSPLTKTATKWKNCGTRIIFRDSSSGSDHLDSRAVLVVVEDSRGCLGRWSVCLQSAIVNRWCRKRFSESGRNTKSLRTRISLDAGQVVMICAVLKTELCSRRSADRAMTGLLTE